MTTSIRSLYNQKDTTVLSASDFSRIRRLSRPPEADVRAENERTRTLSRHERALFESSKWPNSIANQRKARLTRLQQAKDDHEAEMRQLDAEEKQRRKDERREQLLRAAELAFQDKPEIRAVNRQLLLSEVTRERNRQCLWNERQKEREQQKEEEFHQEQLRQYKEWQEKENEIARQRREKARQVAEGFRKQKAEVEERKMNELMETQEEEHMLQKEAKRLLDEEIMNTIKRKEMLRKQNEENRRNNEALEGIKLKLKEIEEIEDRRLLQQKIWLDEEMDRRQEAERKRRADRQAAQDRLIETQARNLAEIKAKQQQFDDSQYELQYAKDKKQIEELYAKQKRLAEERRQEYLETMAKIEAKKNRKKEKIQFPPDEDAMRLEEQRNQLDAQRMNARKELAIFQQKQAEEKRERDNSEREREKLEYNRMLQLQDEQAREAQDYAREMLLLTRKNRKF